MANFATNDTIAEHTHIGTKAATKAASFVFQASAELKSLITSDQYDTILAQGSGNQQYEQCEQAESLLALSFALPFLNLRPTDRGGLSKIIGLDSQTSEQLMSAREMEHYAGIIRRQAIELLGDLIPDVDDDESYYAGPFGISATENFADV